MRRQPQCDLHQGPPRAAHALRRMPARCSSAKHPEVSDDKVDLVTLGFWVADSGPHTSKTLMLQEPEILLAAIPADAPAKAYRTAIVEENVLGKRTLYAFKETASRPLFRMVRRLWDVDPVQPYQRQVCLRPIAKRRDET